MPLGKESIERSSEAIVIDFLDRDLPEQVGAALLGPFRDVDQRGRSIQPRCNQKTENFSMAELSPRIGGKVLIDNCRDVHPFQQRKITASVPKLHASESSWLPYHVSPMV